MTNGSVVGLGNMVLVSPNRPMYDTAMKILQQNPIYGHAGCYSAPEEQLFSEIWLTHNATVRMIHQRYNFYTGKFGWFLKDEIPRVQQYYHGKPWDDIKSREDVAASPWPDMLLWWKIADDILTDPQNDKWFYGCVTGGI